MSWRLLPSNPCQHRPWDQLPHVEILSGAGSGIWPGFYQTTWGILPIFPCFYPDRPKGLDDFCPISVIRLNHIPSQNRSASAISGTFMGSTWLHSQGPGLWARRTVNIPWRLPQMTLNLTFNTSGRLSTIDKGTVPQRAIETSWWWPHCRSMASYAPIHPMALLVIKLAFGSTMKFWNLLYRY
jgi:hypothetical protein